MSPNAILGKLIDESQGQYDPAKFVYLAGAERGTRLCMTFAHSRVKTLDDARVAAPTRVIARLKAIIEP